MSNQLGRSHSPGAKAPAIGPQVSHVESRDNEGDIRSARLTKTSPPSPGRKCGGDHRRKDHQYEPLSAKKQKTPRHLGRSSPWHRCGTKITSIPQARGYRQGVNLFTSAPTSSVRISHGLFRWSRNRLQGSTPQLSRRLGLDPHSSAIGTSYKPAPAAAEGQGRGFPHGSGCQHCRRAGAQLLGTS